MNRLGSGKYDELDANSSVLGVIRNGNLREDMEKNP